MPRAATLAHRLIDAAQDIPDALAFRFLIDGEDEADEITFGELGARASELARVLADVAEPGDRAIVLCPSGLDAIIAVYGCLLARLAAVPVNAPHPSRIESKHATLLRIFRQCRPRVVLANGPLSAARPRFAELSWEYLAPRWVAVDRRGSMPRQASLGGRPPLPAPEDLAILQYTSGSTSHPKGVMLTHGNLLANQQVVFEVTRGTEQDEWGASWLPLFHDMGLSFLFHAVFVRGGCTLLSPLHFLQQPSRWLRAIARYGCACTASPNFGLDWTADKVPAPSLDGLRLDSLRRLFVGAEPVRASTLSRFTAAFAPVGFKGTALTPCFGLAESTLLSTFSSLGAPAVAHFDTEALASGTVEPATKSEESAQKRITTLVGNGRAAPDHDVIIVDRETKRRLPPRQLGEIWISGPSVAQGYWDAERETREVFHAEPEPADGRAYLRTGDLGFIHDGELFIAGRCKDVMIVCGRNVYPDDVEAIARDADPRIGGGVAAFELAVGRVPGIGVVAEQNRSRIADAADLVSHIRERVASHLDVDVIFVGLVQPRRLPRTSSGKISRSRCRTLLSENRLELVAEWRLAP